MGRPPKGPVAKTEILTLRVTSEWMARLDRYREEISLLTAGGGKPIPVSKTDAALKLIDDALDQRDRDKKRSRGK